MSKTKTEKDFDAVKFAREAKDKLDAKLSKMTKEEIIAYFKEQRIKKLGKAKCLTVCACRSGRNF